MTRRARILSVAFWAAPALVATFGMRLVPSRLNPGLSTLEVLGIQLVVWLCWGLWSLLIFAVGDRFPFERGRVTRALAVHVPLCAGVVLAQILVLSGIARTAGIGESHALSSTLALGLRGYGDLFTVVYWGIVGAHGAMRWNAAYRDAELRTARLDQDLAEARLRALQSQLRPHFMFNALNSVVSMIEHDPAGAQRMVVQLADLLRATLRAGDKQLIPLGQEIELTRLYLAIEEVRFADRLAVAWSVDADQALLVPALALQPLVENAIVHGIARRAGAGRLAIDIHPEREDLVLRVTDDGPGPGGDPPAAGAAGGTGTALRNLRERLARLFGTHASLELGLPPPGTPGSMVTLRVPARYAAGAATPVRLRAD